jgi:hypothetical protein
MLGDGLPRESKDSRAKCFRTQDAQKQASRDLRNY